MLTVNLLPRFTVFWVVVWNFGSADDSVTSPCMCLKKMVDKLHNPVEYVTIRRDNSVLSLIVEQRGVVRVFEGEQERAAPFMDITDRVTTSDQQGEQRGLLSLALHPNYSHSLLGRVFVYYVTSMGAQDRAVISQFMTRDDVVDVTSERRLLAMDQMADGGNGGQLLFGDDGYLYIFTGDGAGRNESTPHAQLLDSYLGKALRVDVDGQRFEPGESSRAYMYDVPPTNPFLGQPGVREEIFALGFFNPWRCSQDSVKRGGTGAVYCGDTGTNRFEEINIVQKGRNYGWNLKEGDHCYNTSACLNIENEGRPIHTYPYSSLWGSAVVGGVVYRGTNLSSLVGHYVFGDAISGEVSTLHKSEATSHHWTRRPLPVCSSTLCPCEARHVTLPFLLAFGIDHDGELMLLMTSEFSTVRDKGALFRVMAPIRTSGKGMTCGGHRQHQNIYTSLLLLLLPTALLL